MFLIWGKKKLKFEVTPRGGIRANVESLFSSEKFREILNQAMKFKEARDDTHSTNDSNLRRVD